MKKGNIRSIRFSDELIEIIDQQVGDNFTEKQIKRLDQQIADKQEALHGLQDRYYTGCQFLNALEARLRELNRLFDSQL